MSPVSICWVGRAVILKVNYVEKISLVRSDFFYEYNQDLSQCHISDILNDISDTV